MKDIETLFLQEKLLQEGIISAKNLSDVVALRDKENISFIQALIKLELLTEEKAVSFLIKTYRWPFVEVDKYQINKEIANLLPKEIAKKNNMILIDKIGSVYCLVLSQPLEEEQLTEIKTHIKGNFSYMVSQYSKVLKICEAVYV